MNQKVDSVVIFYTRVENHIVIFTVDCSTRELAEDVADILSEFRKWQSVFRIHDDGLKNLIIRLNQSEVKNLYKLYDRFVNDHSLTHIGIIDKVPLDLLDQKINYLKNSVCQYPGIYRGDQILIITEPSF